MDRIVPLAREERAGDVLGRYRYVRAGTTRMLRAAAASRRSRLSELEGVFELLRDVDPIFSREEPEAPASMLDESKDDAQGRLPLSTPPDQPVSLEGVATAIAFAALLA